MSISYQSKDDRVLSIALKVQELVVRKKDAVVSVSGLNVTVNVGEAVEGSVSGEAKPVVIHCDDSIGFSWYFSKQKKNCGYYPNSICGLDI